MLISTLASLAKLRSRCGNSMTALFVACFKYDTCFFGHHFIFFPIFRSKAATARDYKLSGLQNSLHNPEARTPGLVVATNTEGRTGICLWQSYRTPRMDKTLVGAPGSRAPTVLQGAPPSGHISFPGKCCPTGAKL